VLLALSALACLPAGAQHATEDKAEANWKLVCRQAMAQPLAARTPAGPLTQDELKDCDETALYYGQGAKPDYAAALQCGWFERAHPQNGDANLFHGPGVLAMLYANGRGVPRDYDLAIRFACEIDWAANAEFESRVGHLERLRETHPPNASFDLCDDITSGASQGFCASVRSTGRDVVRDGQIAAIVARFPPAAKSAFLSLQSTESAFEDARVSGEVDASGTARAALQLDEQARLADQFLINLQRFGSGSIPPASATDLSTLDRMLNEVYQKIQHSPASKWEYGTIKPEGIRDTERKWVALLESWTVLGRIAYPNLSRERIRAQLIRLRLHQLRSLDSD